MVAESAICNNKSLDYCIALFAPRNRLRTLSVRRRVTSYAVLKSGSAQSGHLDSGLARAINGCMNANDKQYRVESHNWKKGDLMVFGGVTMTSFGLRIKPQYLSKSEAWAQAKKCMTDDSEALVIVYQLGRKVWSNKPCSY